MYWAYVSYSHKDFEKKVKDEKTVFNFLVEIGRIKSYIVLEGEFGLIFEVVTLDQYNLKK